MLKGSDAHVLFVQFVLLQSDSLHEVIDASVLSFQHHLKAHQAGILTEPFSLQTVYQFRSGYMQRL